jgi:hypothetical protein
MKVGKKKKPESFYIPGYLLELIIKKFAIRKNKLKSGEFGPFSHEKSFEEVKIW